MLTLGNLLICALVIYVYYVLGLRFTIDRDNGEEYGFEKDRNEWVPTLIKPSKQVVG